MSKFVITWCLRRHRPLSAKVKLLGTVASEGVVVFVEHVTPARLQLLSHRLVILVVCVLYYPHSGANRVVFDLAIVVS